MKMFDLSLLKDPQFILFVIGRCLSMAGLLLMYTYTVARAVSLGISKLNASFLLTSIGVGSAAGRALTGVVATASCTSRMSFYYTSTLLGGVLVCLSIPIAANLYLSFVLYAAFGLTLGGRKKGTGEHQLGNNSRQHLQILINRFSTF